MSPWCLTYVTEYELVLLKHVNFTKWKKTSAIDFKPGLHKQRKPLRPIIGFDRTRGWGYSTKFYTGRIWDVPSGVIFCGSCILMLLGICCIYFSNTFFIMLLSVPGFLLLPEQYRWLLSPTFFRWFRFEGLYILTVHGMVISKSRQVLSCLFLITMSGLLAFISRSVCQSLYWHLPQDCDTVFFCYCLCLYSSLCRCFGVDTDRDIQRRFTLKYVKNTFEAT